MKSRILRRADGSGQSGHTLVELIVVTTLMALITMLIAQAWRPIGHSTAELREEATGLTELRVGLAYLRQDLGGALRVQSLDGEVLHIKREPASLRRFGLGQPDADPGVEYRLEQGSLQRTDRHTGESFAVARQLSGFEITPSRNGVRLLLSSRYGKQERALEVQWSR